MKLLLLATLLSAGATAQRIRAWAVWQFSNVFQCTICEFHPVTQYNDYGCYCGLRSPDTPVYELDRCCWTWDNCYDQAKNLESCKLLTDNPYTSSYSYLCSGNEVTCSDKNNACEAFICNCDQQATICFSMAPYTL